MIKGIGIDIVELKRLNRSAAQQEKLVNRILTKKEKELYNLINSSTRKVEFLGGRFAAKEAFAKAVGTGIGKLSFQDIEILRNELGGPTIQVTGYESQHIFISISHSADYAVAQVIIEEGV